MLCGDATGGDYVLGIKKMERVTWEWKKTRMINEEGEGGEEADLDIVSKTLNFDFVATQKVRNYDEEGRIPIAKYMGLKKGANGLF